jgi:hypothetical protein
MTLKRKDDIEVMKKKVSRKNSPLVGFRSKFQFLYNLNINRKYSKQSNY